MPRTKTTIFLIRHAQTEKNVEQKLLGQTDSPLTTRGLAQAEQVAKYLGKNRQPIKAIYSSDLGRSLHTARIIGKHLNLIPIKSRALRECNFGKWQGLSFEEVMKKWEEKTGKLKSKGYEEEDIRPPGGENTYDHQRRVMKKINAIVQKHQGKQIVIVAHSGTCKVALGAMKGLSPDEFYSLLQENGCINIIEAGTNSGRYRVLKINVSPAAFPYNNLNENRRTQTGN